MYALPPGTTLIASADSPWLMPIRFALRPYIELCLSFDRALAELEARFPSHRPVLTLEGRNKRLTHRPK